MVPPRSTTQQTTAARAAEAPPAPAPEPVVLISLFDRNGDGKIDSTTWVDGGDAFVTVGKDVAAILSRPVSHDHAPPPTPPLVPTTETATSAAADAPPTVHQAAASAYQHYGTP
jgi:hypothetical protein